MHAFTEQDVRIIREVQLRFDEFIPEPEKTEIWCPRCHTYVEQGRMPTEALMVAARCRCGTEAVLVSEYKKLDQDDWNRIANAI
jgi:hypothetical protein